MHNSQYRRMEFIRDRVLQTDFSSFLAKSFHTVQPGAAFEAGWHLDLIAEYLEACRTGEITRLIVNLPPRSLKSICVSVAWPAWLLAQDPATRILCASYSSRLSLKHALDCRMILRAPWFQHVFPHTRISSDQNTQHKVITTRRGYRFATSVGGTLTGEGGKVLIVDDPLHALQAQSETYRSRANQWFDQSFITRLDDRKTGIVVVVMQRLHEDDLTGHLLGKAEWQQLCLPLYAPKTVRLAFGRVSRKWQEGESLHPLRYRDEDIQLLQRELGSQAFSAQYLQEPVPQKGSGIEREWFTRYAELPAADIIRTVQSWDTAFKSGGGNDPTACLTFAETAVSFYLADVHVARMEYPVLRRSVIEQAKRWNPSAILIEDKASGQSLIQDLRQNTQLPVIAITPHMDKRARFYASMPLMEAGRIMLPTEAVWLAEFERELFSFPHAAHDDQVDALTQYLHWKRSESFRFSPQLRRI